MKRRFPYLAASIAELARFFALMLLAGNIGAAGENEGMSRFFRYAAAPQLLFAAGFFFMWLDAARYGPYRPLLAVGKIVCLLAFVPFVAFVVFSLGSPGLGLADPPAAFLASLFVALEDAGALAVLGICGRPGGGQDVVVPGAAPAGQGIDEIEKVEV